MHYFITGTDTGAGKTYVTCLLLQALREEGIRAVGYKPVSCGGLEDAKALQEASEEGLTLEEINPLAYLTAAAPLVAAQIESKPMEIAPLVDGFLDLQSRFDVVLVEGAGGWAVPISEEESMADLAKALGLPVVVVVNNRLGALNHSLLTWKAIQETGLPQKGWIFNHLVDELDLASVSNKGVLERLTQLPILAEVLRENEWIEADWVEPG
ncbi:MAG: dethiobiotin synthase [Verrucomicrobiota bacterium]